ncbi:MAG: DUF4293 family protein [Rhodothermales bacterium]|nr:DUF4293 family protein [Rhodothermales bacterium]
MIQRIQTAFLLLVVVCTAALFSLQTPVSGLAATMWPWFTNAFYLMAAVVVLASGIGIAQFRDRPRQLRTVAFVSLATLALVVLFGVAFAVGGDFESGQTEVFTTTALAVAAFVFAMLARRAIARDIALVKSMDRLR